MSSQIEAHPEISSYEAYGGHESNSYPVSEPKDDELANHVIDLSKEQEDEEAVVAVCKEGEVSPFVKKQRKRYCFMPPRLFAVVVLLIFLVVFSFLALALDLWLAPVEDTSVESVEIDASQTSPHGSMKWKFQYGSRLSEVQPVQINCHVPGLATADRVGRDPKSADTSRYVPNGGRLIITFHEDPDHENLYLVEVTSPEEDAASHAAVLWDLTMVPRRNDSKKDTEEFLEMLSCDVTAEVTFGHMLPMNITFSVTGTQIADAVSEYSHDADVNRESEDSKFTNCEQQSASMFEVRKANLFELEMGVKLAMPEALRNFAPYIRLILPPIDVHAQERTGTTVTSKIPSAAAIRLDGVNTVFSAKESDFESEERSSSTTDNCNLSMEEDWMVIGLNCPTSDLCPWFGSLLDWYSQAQKAQASDSDVTIDVAVNGNGSFLEAFMGHEHVWSVRWEPATSGETNADGSDSAQRRKLLPSGLSATNCLRLVDDVDTLEISWCWSLIFSKGFMAVGSARFYDDYGVEADMVYSWNNTNNDLFVMDLQAELDLDLSETANDYSDLMNVSGQFRLEWLPILDQNIDNLVIVNISCTNQGTFSPFEVYVNIIATEASGTDIIEFVVPQFYMDFENGFSVDGTAAVTFDYDALSFDMFFLDPEEASCIFTGSIITDESRLAGNGTCTDDMGDFLFRGKLGSAVEEVSDTLRRFTILLTEEVVNFNFTVDSQVVDVPDGFRFEVVNLLLSTDQELLLDSNGLISLTSDNNDTNVVDEFDFQFLMQDFGRLDFSTNTEGTLVLHDTDDTVELILNQGMLGWNQQERFNLNGVVTIVPDNNSVSMNLEDTANNVLMSLALLWVREDTLQGEILTISSAESLNVEWDGTNSPITSVIEVNVNLDELIVDVQADDTGPLGIGVDGRAYLWNEDDDDDSVTLGLERLIIRWQDETRVNVTSQLLIDPDGNNIEASLLDTASGDFNNSMKVTWEDEDDIFTMQLEELYVRVGSDTFVDLTGTFQLNDMSVNMSCLSQAEADLQMGMEMFVFYNDPDDDDGLTVLLNRMQMGWKDVLFIDAGGDAQSGPSNGGDGDRGNRISNNPSGTRERNNSCLMIMIFLLCLVQIILFLH